MVAVSLNNLSKSFGAFEALSAVNLDVETGEFLTLLGPSGCGKTTLLKIISGFILPTSGEIKIGGKDVTNVPPENRDTALCFQSYALFPHLTVRQNLEFGLKQKKIETAQRKVRIAEVSDVLELDAQLDKLPNELSGGQQQRVSLGRALIMRPSVILFDEPLSNLDAKLRDQVRVEIRRIQQDYKLTAIYVTHDQAEALAMSDRIVVLNNGKIEQVDTPKTLYSAPRTGFVADFIGNANVFVGKVRGGSGTGPWEISTPIGLIQTASFPGKAGQDVTVCWRPEVAKVGNGPLSGRITNIAYQGNFTDLSLNTNGIFYRIQTSDSTYIEGTDVTFSVDAADVIVLESE